MKYSFSWKISKTPIQQASIDLVVANQILLEMQFLLPAKITSVRASGCNKCFHHHQRQRHSTKELEETFTIRDSEDEWFQQENENGSDVYIHHP